VTFIGKVLFKAAITTGEGRGGKFAFQNHPTNFGSKDKRMKTKEEMEEKWKNFVLKVT
jgi:hypothetical protein